MKNINSRIIFFIILSFASDVHAEVTKLVCNFGNTAGIYNDTVVTYSIDLDNNTIERELKIRNTVMKGTDTFFDIVHIDDYHILAEHKHYNDQSIPGRLPKTTYRSTILILRKESIVKGADFYFSLSDLNRERVESFEVKCSVLF